MSSGNLRPFCLGLNVLIAVTVLATVKRHVFVESALIPKFEAEL